MDKNIIILAGGASSRMKNSMISKDLSEEELKNAKHDIDGNIVFWHEDNEESEE